MTVKRSQLLSRAGELPIENGIQKSAGKQSNILEHMENITYGHVEEMLEHMETIHNRDTARQENKEMSHLLMP